MNQQNETWFLANQGNFNNAQLSALLTALGDPNPNTGNTVQKRARVRNMLQALAQNDPNGQPPNPLPGFPPQQAPAPGQPGQQQPPAQQAPVQGQPVPVQQPANAGWGLRDLIIPGIFFLLLAAALLLVWKPWEGDDDGLEYCEGTNAVYARTKSGCPGASGINTVTPGATATTVAPPATPRPGTTPGAMSTPAGTPATSTPTTGGGSTGGPLRTEAVKPSPGAKTSNEWNGPQLDQSKLPAAGPNELYYAHGDLNDSGTCSFATWGPGQKPSISSKGTWQLYVAKDGTEQSRKAQATAAQEVAARGNNGSCPVITP